MAGVKPLFCFLFLTAGFTTKKMDFISCSLLWRSHRPAQPNMFLTVAAWMLLENSLWDMQPAWWLQQSPLHLPNDLLFGACGSCLCCATWKLGAPFSQTLLAKREGQKGGKGGCYTFSVRVVSDKKRNIMLKNGGKWRAKLAAASGKRALATWLYLTNEYRKNLKNTTESCFWHRKCNTKAKEKGETISISMGLKSEEHTNQLPSPCRLLQRF